MYSHEITNLRVIPFGNIFASLWFSVLSAPHSPKGVVRKPWQLHTMYMRFISFLEHYFVNFPERPNILNSLGLSVHILKIIANFSKITKKSLRLSTRICTCFCRYQIFQLHLITDLDKEYKIYVFMFSFTIALAWRNYR